MHLRFSSLAIATAFAFPGSAVAQSPESQTVGQYMLERQRELMTPSAAYCVQQFPDSEADFRAATDRFRQIATEATEGLRAKMNSELLQKPVPASMLAADPAKALVEQGRVQGPEKFCPAIFRMMKETSAAELRQAVEDAFAQMERAAQAKSGNGR